jgi:hypothetical protein
MFAGTAAGSGRCNPRIGHSRPISQFNYSLRQAEFGAAGCKVVHSTRVEVGNGQLLPLLVADWQFGDGKVDDFGQPSKRARSC